MTRFDEPAADNPISAPGFAVRPDLLTLALASPRLVSGRGVPTRTDLRTGSAYMNLDGASANTLLYIYDGSSWNAVPLAIEAAELDQEVVVDIAVADSASGVATVLMTLALTRANGDGTTPIASLRQVLIRTGATAYEPGQALNGTTTFGTVTAGSIVASGTGWALVTTDAVGAFACTVTNSADEIVQFWTETAKGGDLRGERCSVVHSNVADPEWIA